ncbi:DUF1697 domain-containing protein [Anaeromyxobacter sp. PSR-1]|uniref:DUF1697 domain-containing protein n=1 Tax=Anaeromyxobacter sp. PSR-1 TaxID=1300915 RepID=UPI0005E650E1|nr:DUF1697 domain-containing protein [Anaeromyxobacter sp. PSR-1]GAO01206.1 hypothetical protein PSR1_00058 [Anaeromyxobacter sp. PSR-1]
MSRYLVLLRGINVGGKNLIGMPALKAAFEADGFSEVATYIQSGNVLVSTSERGATLVPRIEAMLSSAFDYPASVVVLSRAQLRRVVEHAPDGFGTRPERFRYDAIFLKAPLSPAQAVERVPVNPEVDEVTAGPGVLYFSRLIAKASQSRMSRVIGQPTYKQMTIRNWNTTTRLHELMGE